MHKADVTLQEGGPRKAGAVLCAIPAKGQPKKSCEVTCCRGQGSQAGLEGECLEQIGSEPGGPQVGWGVLVLSRKL